VPGALPAPATLHPAVWQAHQLARPGAAVQASGLAALDAELPGGGWPRGALTELLLPHPGVGELRLLAPVLVALQAAGRVLMWFDPPAAPCAAGLAPLGLDLQRLVLVRSKDELPGARAGRGLPWRGDALAVLRGGAGLEGTPERFEDRFQDRGRAGSQAGLQASLKASLHERLRQRLPAADTLWALEQALKSGHVGAVLAWLPARLPLDVLRRLQLAAQAHDGPAFVLRDAAARHQPSPAPLRLLLAADGPDGLCLQLLKRRGPPATAPLRLALPPVLPGAVATRWVTQQALRQWLPVLGRPGRVAGAGDARSAAARQRA
jgi:protein ImuA